MTGRTLNVSDRRGGQGWPCGIYAAAMEQKLSVSCASILKEQMPDISLVELFREKEKRKRYPVVCSTRAR